ncbi:glycosyltransferase family 2 protein [Flavobacterium sp.]|uniref:glycosyltransferase family 2 protein n=1 Tax=Flavobacterium sp. TaxID=239 RepID=UPI002486EFFB|nr:glycosyltransferase family 2 protein [Flavobacterium sp.]MDI1318514.1 glycosyltransferase family 2 protein [Flavobacterium sp.]
MSAPKVSIIMATYNRADYIVESLLAIQNQTFDSWECIIIDDGGSDNTLEVITPLLEKDSRFNFYKRTDKYIKGLPGCRNFGIDLAQGDCIIFFDDDDIPHPQNLELCVKELTDNTIYFCRYIREVFFDDFDYKFDYSKQYTTFSIDKNDVEKMLKNELPFNSCAVMWKKECFEKNRFIETLMYAEEWELYSRIVSSGYNGISIDKCLFYGRKHQNSNTGEFYNDNPIRRKSYVDAILNVIENLKDKNLLSNSIIRYFLLVALNFKEFSLSKKIITSLELSTFQRIKWVVLYNFWGIKKPVYRIKKKLLKK